MTDSFEGSAGGFGEAAEVKKTETSVDAPLVPDAGPNEQPLTPGDPASSESAGASVLPFEDLSMDQMHARLKEIEDNDNPDKFGQRVDLYAGATRKYMKNENGTVQNLLDMRNDEQNVDRMDKQFEYLERNVQQIFAEYEKVFVAELQGLQGDAVAAKAAELLSQFTGQTVTPEQVTFLENGQIRDPEAFRQLLSESTSVSKMVEKFAQIHDLAKLPIKEREAVELEKQKVLEAIDQENISEEKKKERKKTTTEKIDSVFATAEKKVDVPSLINTLFAIDKGYSDIKSAFRNGLEKKDESLERSTMSWLSQVFREPGSRSIFFQSLLELSSDEVRKPTVLQDRLRLLLKIEEGMNEEDKKKKIQEIKLRMFTAFDKVGREGLLLSLSSPDDINLSTSVVQMLVLEAEKE